MAKVTKPVILDETGKSIKDAIDSSSAAILAAITDGYNKDLTLQEVVDARGEFTALGQRLNTKPYYFNNVADMKAANLKSGDYVITLGYYEVNDGGGSEYVVTDSVSQTDYQEELNNELYANKIKDFKRLYNAPFGVNAWWANSNGTLRSDRYNYRDNGITAIYQDIDDYVEVGLTHMCFAIQLVKNANDFEISGGSDYLDDLILASEYARSKGIIIDTIRIMGTTTNTTLLSSDLKTSYLSIIDTILEKFSDNKFIYFNVLNELHTNIVDDVSFASNCINKIYNAGKKSIVSIELYNKYSQNDDILEFLNNVDVIGLNIYPRCASDKNNLSQIQIEQGVINTLTYFNKIKSLNKEIFITETGVIDYYSALIRTSYSTSDIPVSLQIPSYGLTEKTLMLEMFKYYGNNVSRIYNWWTNGLTYPSYCKDNAKELCNALLQKGRD